LGAGLRVAGVRGGVGVPFGVASAYLSGEFGLDDGRAGLLGEGAFGVEQWRGHRGEHRGFSGAG
jgi:hypothetical protein